jgi:hypothetical protein
MYSVSGKVLVDGEPATRAEITLHPLDPLHKKDDKTVRPFAVVDPDGSFRLSTYETCDGAPAGEYAVTVVWPSFTTDPLGEETPGPDRLRKRYADARRSAFRATIREGDNQLPPFELTAR